MIRLYPEPNRGVAESEQDGFIPKNVFNNKETPKPKVKEEQKVNIIGGKKRIQPIFLSPKKKFKD